MSIAFPILVSTTALWWALRAAQRQHQHPFGYGSLEGAERLGIAAWWRLQRGLSISLPRIERASVLSKSRARFWAHDDP